MVCRLQVDGAIVAEEIVVQGTLSDYVFDPNYRNRTLTEVAEFIKENHHLPGVPSAKEASEKGISLGNMQTKLLEKIEELTLHMIAAQQRSDGLQRENQALRERLDQLEKLVVGNAEENNGVRP